MKYNDLGEFLDIEICNNEKVIKKCIMIRNFFMTNGNSLQSVINDLKLEERIT